VSGCCCCCVSSCPWPRHDVHDLQDHSCWLSISLDGLLDSGGPTAACALPQCLAGSGRRGDVSSSPCCCCCSRGQDSNEVSTIPAPKYTDRLCAKMRRAMSQHCPGCCLTNPPKFLPSDLARCYVCVSCPAPTHPLKPTPTIPLHRFSTMLLQRGVFLSCLLASAVAFAPSMRARAVSWARLEAREEGGRECYRMGWRLIAAAAAAVDEDATALCGIACVLCAGNVNKSKH